MPTMDPIIATKVNTSLKACATTFAHSATEAATPQIRQAFTDASANAIRRQEQLFSLMEQRGWYRPTAAHAEDIQQVLPQLQSLTRGSPVGASL